MEKFIHPRQRDRRSGRTTRAIDEMIQHFFTHGVVMLWDHAEDPKNLAFKHMERIFFDRLYREHNLGRSDLDYNTEEKSVRLK